MAKKKLEPGIVNFPMPVAVVGAMVGAKPNYLTVAWISMASYAPPMIAVTLGNHHHTNQGIREQGAFSVNFPSSRQVVEVDYAGLVSGATVDKSGLFEHSVGEASGAPLITDFPLCVECRLAKVVENGRNETFIGEIVAIHADELILRNGKPDLAALEPLILGQTDQQYWSLGQAIGRAWSVGNKPAERG